LFPLRTKKLKEIEYKIFIKTSDVKYAGTNANVYIQLFGDEEDTGIIFFFKFKFNLGF
jgi:hypothetical protein